VTDAVELVSGSNHTCALLESGRVTCWGLNSQGQLGLGSEQSLSGPVELTGISDVINLSAKANFTIAIKKEHTARYWGAGLGNTLSSTSVKNVADLDDVVSVGVGLNHACAVHENGDLSCWGGNDCSQSGPSRDEMDPVTSPTYLYPFSGVEAFAGGSAHSCVIMTGDVWCWGGHSFGEAGGAITCGAASSAERVVDNVKQIAAGFGHTVALTDDGEVVAWGMNDDGQLGYAVPSSPPTSAQALPVDGVGLANVVAVGESQSCAVLQTGEAMCWGRNYDG